MVVCNDTRTGGGQIENSNLRHTDYKLSITRLELQVKRPEHSVALPSERRIPRSTEFLSKKFSATPCV